MRDDQEFRYGEVIIRVPHRRHYCRTDGGADLEKEIPGCFHTLPQGGARRIHEAGEPYRIHRIGIVEIRKISMNFRYPYRYRRSRQDGRVA